MSDEEQLELLRRCKRQLSGNFLHTATPKKVLTEMADQLSPEVDSDFYGEGPVINDFEAEIAALLGKEAVVFMPSGTMAQQIALRIWSDQLGSKHVAFHPTCHLEIHERKGYQMLHGLHGVLVGSPDRLMTLAELQSVAEPLCALLLELPQREIGGQLPTWEDLVAMTSWTRGQGIPLHLDGARLWESGPFYQRSYAEIAGLFDSVYVSFYKGLGGISGAALAGPADFIAEARIWQRRYGGNLKSLYPYVLSARMGFDQYLPRMETYYRKAIEVAAVLAEFPQIEIVPNPPQTNMMHLYFRGNRDRLEKATREIAREEGVMLFYSLAPSPIPAYHKLEVTIKDAALEFSTQELRHAFELLFEKVGD